MSCLDAVMRDYSRALLANYNGFAVAAGVRVVTVSSAIETGFALPPIEDFEKKISPRTKAIVICNPNNPTGYLYSAAEMEVLKEIVVKHNLFLFSDEAYREFCYDGTHFSAMHLKGVDENVVLMIPSQSTVHAAQELVHW
jgi:aspartate aminotransferase